MITKGTKNNIALFKENPLFNDLNHSSWFLICKLKLNLLKFTIENFIFLIFFQLLNLSDVLSCEISDKSVLCFYKWFLCIYFISWFHTQIYSLELMSWDWLSYTN